MWTNYSRFLTCLSKFVSSKNLDFVMDNDEDNNDEEESEDEVVFIETRDEEMGKCVILLILLAFLSICWSSSNCS